MAVFDVNYRKNLKSVDKHTNNVVDENNSIRVMNDPFLITDRFPERKDLAELKIRERLAKEFSEELLNNSFKNDLRIKDMMSSFINNLLDEFGYSFLTDKERYHFINDFIMNLTGFGVLQPLMDDPDITEIYTIRYDAIYYKKNGKKCLSDVRFKSAEAVKNYIDAILAPLGRRVDNMNPIEDARLPNGDRVAISGSAISPNGYSFNIRKFSRTKIVMNDLVERFETIDRTTADLLQKLVQMGVNIIVSGGTGSGKTTFLNALADYIRDDWMIASVEDNLELQLHHELWLPLEARHANIEGKGEVTLAEGLKHFMRRSPDVIIVGEIRDGDVGQVYLQAVNTGHVAYATIHSNSPVLCRQRIVNLISGTTGTAYNSIEHEFNTSVNVIVQLEKFNDLNRILMMNLAFVDDLTGDIIDVVKFNPKTKDWDHIDQYPRGLELLFEKYTWMNR